MDPHVLPVATCSATPHTLLPLASQPFVTVACDYVSNTLVKCITCWTNIALYALACSEKRTVSSTSSVVRPLAGIAVLVLALIQSFMDTDMSRPQSVGNVIDKPSRPSFPDK